MTLAELRASLGLTQKQMGEALGIQKQTYADLERGRSVPSGKTMQKICRVTGCSVVVTAKKIEYIPK